MVTEKNKKFIKETIDSFDWAPIEKIYKMVEKGIGDSSTKIAGINRISYKKIKSEDIKNELSIVIEYMMENNIPQLIYGMWDILWVNGEWEIEIDVPDSSDIGSNENLFIPFSDSILDIKFVPQRTIVHEKIDLPEETLTENKVEESDEKILNRILEKSIQEEKYELASKLTEIINNFYRKIRKETKIKKNGKNQKA